MTLIAFKRESLISPGSESPYPRREASIVTVFSFSLLTCQSRDTKSRVRHGFNGPYRTGQGTCTTS